MKLNFSEENSVFTKGFLRDFKKITLFEQTYIKQKLSAGFENPQILFIKKLKNYPRAQYRIRIKSFRILFSVDSVTKKIIFSHCKHRKDLY